MVITTDLQHVLLEPGIERRWTCPCDHNWVATVWSVPWGAQPWPAMGRWLVDLAHHNGDCWGHPSIVVMVFMLLLNVCSVVLMFFFPGTLLGGFWVTISTWCFCSLDVFAWMVSGFVLTVLFSCWGLMWHCWFWHDLMFFVCVCVLMLKVYVYYILYI